MRGNSRFGSMLGIFGTPHPQTLSTESSLNHPYILCCNSVIIPWTINSTVWCSQLLYTFWWRAGGGSGFLGSIHWYCVQKNRSGGDILPHTSLSVVHRSALPLWTGYLKILHYLTYMRRPWFCMWLPGARRLSWPGYFPQMRFLSWGGRSSSLSSDPKIRGWPESRMY